MIQRILFFFLLSIGYQTLTAQDVAGCTYLLEDAKEAYGAGMVELIPDLLLPCLGEDGLKGGPRREAYKLVINSYLFDHMPQEAEQLMARFVDEYPSYRAGDTDPAEFVLLLNTQLLSKGIDPEDVEEYVAESDTVRQRTRRPKREKVLGVEGHSLGFQVGANGTLPQVIERYSLGNPGQDQGHFGILPGFQLGATINFLISERFDISSALLFNQTRFKYTGSPLSFTTYTYKESGSYFQLPVSLVWKLNPESQGLSYYVRGGFVGEYLLAAKGQGTRTDSPSGNEFVAEKTDVSALRQQINLSAMAGVGLRYPLNRSFFFAEARFTYGILKANKAENRYQNTDLNWTLYYIDSDFRKHQISLCAGICWNISKMEER
jgi:hypothetical protein